MRFPSPGAGVEPMLDVASLLVGRPAAFVAVCTAFWLRACHLDGATSQALNYAAALVWWLTAMPYFDRLVRVYREHAPRALLTGLARGARATRFRGWPAMAAGALVVITAPVLLAEGGVFGVLWASVNGFFVVQSHLVEPLAEWPEAASRLLRGERIG